MSAKRRELGGGGNGAASPEDLILVLYTDGAAKTERSRSLQKMGCLAGPRRKRRGTSSMQGVANRLPTENMSPMHEHMPAAKKKREMGAGCNA